MWMEVYISGVGEKIELTPIGKTYRWVDDAFQVIDESPRIIKTTEDSVALNFVDTSGPETLPEEQTIYYGKYALKDLSTEKTIYIDFRDANYPYGTGVVDIVGKWEDFAEGSTTSIWEWRGNEKIPNQEFFS